VSIGVWQKRKGRDERLGRVQIGYDQFKKKVVDTVDTCEDEGDPFWWDLGVKSQRNLCTGKVGRKKKEKTKTNLHFSHTAGFYSRFSSFLSLQHDMLLN